MKHLYVLLHRSAWATLCLALWLAAMPATAQRLNYSTRGFSAIAGTYTDLGNTGTVITTPDFEDSYSAPQEIGFTFQYDGQSYTQFVLHTDGMLRLGAEPAKTLHTESEGSLFNGPMVSDDPGNTNLIAPFSANLAGSVTQTPEYRVATTGTAPNRVCTIQWKNVADLGMIRPRQFAAMSFQVKLYETSNTIEFIYDAITPTANAVSILSTAVGLKGSGIAEGQQVELVKTSAAPWASPKASSIKYSGNSFAVRLTELPVAGLTFQFKATPLQDAAVTNIYSLGQLPLNGLSPHKVKARIFNTGVNAINNVTATLHVTGATDFTSTKTIDLAENEAGFVEFDGYTPVLNGTNQVTVTLSTDEESANNSLTVSQVVNPSLLSYADNTALLTSPRRFEERLTLVRHSLQQAQALKAIRVQIADNTYNTGQTVYGVVLDAAGNIIGRSPSYRLQSTDLRQELTFTLYSPIKLEPNTDYYWGLAQTLLTGKAGYEAVAEQAESPTRPDSAYFQAPLAGGMPHSFVGSRFVISGELMEVPTCLAPLQLSASDLKMDGATLTFSPVAGAGTYTVEYGPRGFVPGTGAGMVVSNVTGSPYQLTGLASGLLYDVFVRTACSETNASGFVGPLTIRTECNPAQVATIPYVIDFNEVPVGALPCGVTVLDANHEGHTWEVAQDPVNDFKNAIRANYSGSDPSDDWIFTAPLPLIAGKQYRVSFDYHAQSSSLPLALAVSYGTAADVESQTTVIWSKTDIINKTYESAADVAIIQPTTTGNYTVGFHATSEIGHGYLHLRNIQVIGEATAASGALSRALNAYPNPAANQLLLEVRGANAKGALQVEIVNMLGQRVYAGTARDNFINRLDVSKLAAGRYILKVQSGQGYAVRAIQVQH